MCVCACYSIGQTFRALCEFSPTATTRNSLESKLVIAVVSNEEVTVNAILNAINQSVAWSMQCAQDNILPVANEHGDELPVKTRPCSDHEPIIPEQDGGPINFVYAGLCGDEVWMCEDFNLPWKSGKKLVCKICRATSSTYIEALPITSWTSSHRTTEEYFDFLREPNAPATNPLTSIPGWSLHNLYEDLLHCDSLGVRQSVAASALDTCANRSMFGPPVLIGSWQCRLDAQLERAHDLFVQHESACGRCTSQPTFRALSLSMHT